MKFKKPILLALSIGLGLTCVAPALAAKDGDLKVENQQTLTRGDGGYWVENTSKTFRFMDLVRKAAVDALTAALGHAPSAAEIDAMLALHNSAPSVDWAVLAKAQVLIAQGGAAASNALAQVKVLEALAQQNKNSNYLSAIPAEYLNWAPGKPLSGAAIAQSGAAPQSWENRFVNAYAGLGIDSKTKMFTRGPLAGQTMSSDYATMMSQLMKNGYITQDFNYDTLIADLGGQGYLDSYGQGRGFYSSNLFGKDNLGDAHLFQRYSARQGDASPRNWVRSDGIGRFNSYNDMDFLMVTNYSTAAKLVAEAKALAALGLTALANAKLNEARNVVLLSANNHDPLVLDLNHNGKIDVTGLSSAKVRNSANNRFVKDGSILFDLLANGSPVQTEWIKGGDAFLVDNSKNAVLNAIASGKPLTGVNLFGDVEGYPGGFMKLATTFDADAKLASLKAKLGAGYGVLKGKELGNLMVWIDNGDGVAAPGEMKTLSEIGVSEIGVIPQMKKANEEMFEQSYFIQNGKKYTMQEVWFLGK